MITIQLSNADMKHEDAIRELMDHMLRFEPNFSGAAFRITYDDYTSVEDPSDQGRAARVYAAITDIAT